MLKKVLGWLAEIADTLGEFFENLSVYPGLGWLAGVGNWFGGWADSYAAYTQRIEWKKRELLSTQNKARELMEKVKPEGEDKDQDQESSATMASATAAGTGGESQAAVPGRAGDSHVARAEGVGEAKLSGTIIFDTTVAEQEVPASSAPARESAGSSRRSAEKRAYYGTLDGPGASLSDTSPVVPPDYSAAPSRRGDSADRRGTLAMVVAPVEPEAVGAPSVAEEPLAPMPASARRTVPPVEEEALPREQPSVRRTAAVSTALAPAVPAGLPAAVRESRPPAPAAISEEEAAIAWSLSQAATSAIDEDQPTLVPVADRDESLARLEYLSCRLRESREPLCGVNGALILIPLAMLRDGTRENVELPRAIQADLITLQDRLGLRFPTTTLLVGLEEHRGFEELVRRIGPQRAGSQRLGHRFDIRLAAVPAQLAVLCARLTGVFEDWVYAIFREHGSIARPGNSQLFGLLCQVRTDLQPRLLRILCGGFGRDGQEDQKLPLGFSGCYFAATGRSEDRRAFVRAVFDKLAEEQNQVEWLGQARAESRGYRILGWLGLWTAAAFAGWLVFELWLGA